MANPSFLRSLLAFRLCLAVWIPSSTLADQVPVAGLILTWQRDPTTTMTVDWHESAPLESPVLLYRMEGGSEWTSVVPVELDFPHAADRKVYRIELTGLEPGGTYQFRPNGREVPYLFRTMPAAIGDPVRVAIGGDTAWAGTFVKMNKVVASLKPDVIFWGGDYSYSDGKAEMVQREIDWHANIRDHLIGDDRRVIPVLAAIGNHEVNSAAAPYYQANFAFPGEQTYGVLDFSDYFSVILLDTNHMARIAGAQTEWLGETLAARAGDRARVLFPVYHVGAYPSVRPLDSGIVSDIKKHWIPLFEKAGMSVAFEHHDHAYKRTHPMLADVVQDDPAKGITYLGDGAWGASKRKQRTPAESPFLARSESVNHIYLMEIAASGPLRFQAIDAEGAVFDEFTLPRKR